MRLIQQKGNSEIERRMFTHFNEIDQTGSFKDVVQCTYMRTMYKIL